MILLQAHSSAWDYSYPAGLILLVSVVTSWPEVDSRYRLLQATWDYLDLLIVVVTSRLEVESVILRS
jgi:hypothetical protein